MTDHSPESIIKALRDHEVTMTPRWHFVVRFILIGALLLAIAAGVLYFGSFLWFSWHHAHYDVLPGFGGAGYAVLALRFPWYHFLVLLLIITTLIILLRHFSLGYRVPVLTLTIGLGAILIGTSYLLVHTPLHERLQERADGRGLPVLGSLYRGMPHTLRGSVHVGVINDVVNAKRFHLVSPQEEEDVTVVITGRTVLESGWQPAVGGRIAVLSNTDEDTITAQAIRSLPEPYFFPR